MKPLAAVLIFLIWNCSISKCAEDSANNGEKMPNYQMLNKMTDMRAETIKEFEKGAEEKVATGELSAKNKCLQQLFYGMQNGVTATLSGLVGVGWDDLTNKITLPVFATEYFKCKTTPDGHFLLPDNVLAIPIQEVIIDRSAKTFKYYNDIEKENIKASRDEGFLKFVGGGSYATGNQEIKKMFSNGDSKMLEASIGYKAFTFIAEPSEALDPMFHQKITEIIESLFQNLPYLAVYQAECLIRDYGTHVVNKVLTGALLRYRIFVKNDSKHTHEAVRQTSTTETSINILSLFGADGKEEASEKKAAKEALDKQTQYSLIETKGGPDVRSIMGSENEKKLMRMDNLVGLEHEGIPIYSIIHSSYFPKYSTFLLLTVQDIITNATKRYYEENTKEGCMDPEYATYDLEANVHDANSCNDTEQDFLFNGFFEKCEPVSLDITLVPSLEKLCLHFSTPHQKGGYDCPKNYEAVLIAEKFHVVSVSGIMYRHCERFDFCPKIRVSAHWCRRKDTVNFGIGNTISSNGFLSIIGTIKSAVAGSSVEKEKGVLFGGLFVGSEDNRITKSPGCPEHYEAEKFFGNVFVCISMDNNHLGLKNAVEFGGFYNCHSQPQSCSPGFTGHFLTDFEECPVYYCIHPSAFTKAQPEPLKRPPFSNFHRAINNQTNDMDPNDAIIEKLIQEEQNISKEAMNSTDYES